MLVLGGTGTIGFVSTGLTAAHDVGCVVVGGLVKMNGFGSGRSGYTRLDPK